MNTRTVEIGIKLGCTVSTEMPAEIPPRTDEQWRAYLACLEEEIAKRFADFFPRSSVLIRVEATRIQPTPQPNPQPKAE